MRPAISAVACCVLAVLAGGAATAAEDLANPFARPRAAEAPRRSGAQHERPNGLELRATLVRGSSSSANIGGTIVRVGERVNGYRLVSVNEGAAVLVDAAGIPYVIEIARPRRVTQ